MGGMLWEYPIGSRMNVNDSVEELRVASQTYFEGDGEGGSDHADFVQESGAVGGWCVHC
jgi:hypothetical protein